MGIERIDGYFGQEFGQQLLESLGLISIFEFKGSHCSCHDKQPSNGLRALDCLTSAVTRPAILRDILQPIKQLPCPSERVFRPGAIANQYVVDRLAATLNFMERRDQLATLVRIQVRNRRVKRRGADSLDRDPDQAVDEQA